MQNVDFRSQHHKEKETLSFEWKEHKQRHGLL